MPAATPRSTMRRTTAMLATIVVGASLAGCGLRVDHAAQLSQGLAAGGTEAVGGAQATGASSGPGGVPATGAELGAAGTVASGSGSAGGGAAGAPGGGTPGGGSSSGSNGGPAALNGPGVTRTTITIGVQVAKNLQAGFAAVGASGTPADESQIVSALTKWVNDTGGLAGRKLVVLQHQTDPTSGSWASQAESVCQDFTQDHKVFAVGSSPVGGSDALLSCLAQAGTPDIEQNLWLFDHVYYRQYPNMLYQPGRASPDRWAKAYVDGLDRMGYFKGATTKVGLLRFDSPVFARITDGVLKPEMTRLGHKFDAEIAITEPSSVSDFGGMAAQFNNAILTLRRQNIDHVMFLENAGEMPFFFMQQADSQHYYPTYGLTSNDIPDTLATQEPSSQLHGAMVVGWTPPNDVGNDHDPGGNPAHDECRKILTKYGVQVQTGFYAQSECDTFFFLRKVIPLVRQFTPAGLAAAVETLGTSYDSPFTFRTRFAPGRHDGADAYRGATYVDSCSCFEYSGPTYPM